MLLSYRDQSTDLQCICKSIDGFLYKCNIVLIWVNLFLANVPILYPLKTPENIRFSGVFRRYKMETLARNG